MGKIKFKYLKSMSFTAGIILLIIGCIIVIKSEWFHQNFGAIQWAEKNLATYGGSRIMYKLIGITFILLGLMGITGLLEGFILWAISPFTKFYR